MLRRTPLKRGKPLRKVSKKHGKALREYSKRRKAFLERHPFCTIGPVLINHGVEEGHSCTQFATEIHHTRRRGPYLNVESTWAPTCHLCHCFCETHANVARSLNLLK